MKDRIWDPNNRYTNGFLKEYRYWALEVSYRQHTLGCFIIFAKRKIEKISELTDLELTELKKVMGEIEKTLTDIPEFRPERFNYWQMGNNLHHLHFHGIPRYSSPRIWNNKKWVDKTYGHPPIWKKSDSPELEIIALQEVITKQLFKNSSKDQKKAGER